MSTGLIIYASRVFEKLLTKSGFAACEYYISTIMKNHFLCVFALFLCVPYLNAQFLPFQGKLFDASDQPLDGTYNFNFSINDGGVVWFENHPGVSIYQGVYAVVLGARGNELPANLFQSSITHTLQVQVNGEVVDNITLYRPIRIDGNPLGTILSFAGPNPPTGYLPCDGREVSKDDYPDLFAAIGTSWGGDGNPNFRLPDLRGRFLRGWDSGAGNDPDAAIRTANHSDGNIGDKVGSYQDGATALPANEFTGSTSQSGNHTHDYIRFTLGDQGGVIQWGGDAIRRHRDRETTSSGEHSHDLTLSGGGDAETRPKNAYVYFIIKAQ